MINTFTRLTLIGAALLSAQTLAWNDDMTLQNTKQLTLDATSTSELNVEAGAGFLNIVGSDTDSITVKAEIYQHQAHNNYCLNLAKKNTAATLTADNCNNNEQQTRIDLTVSLPKTMTLNITDGSGAISIDTTSATKIHDGSGEIHVRNIAGTLDIHDGSGSIEARNITGNVDIQDGSGSIYLVNSQQNVKISDGSGNITVKNTQGNVTISDGSGGINVDKAASFTLLSDGSGSVAINNVPKQNL
ncbi:hypothetical protein CWB85_04355 [Pseudoalteromonas sp. S1727]|uniref:DUF4097 family beta strand repeat protein n=1 Tax=Pseudoalteromonas sp. S1727 TaxID=2066514 RepID=UPI00110927F5|nr:DUF4097 family beta strand repeat protein [Pseudoalteromonas sp. S1727]TMN73354.1 hypothetical protein CWB85_04355 [Pseudoalteromonas sp. S1727]